MVEIFSEILKRFTSSRVLVIGDLMLDESLWGHIQRISPEAPVPILNLERRGYTLGGAGNVVRNLKTLGADVVLLGVLGEDSTGCEILRLLEKLGVDADGVLRDPARMSSRKTRMISMEHNQQVFRMDEESTHPIDRDQEEAMLGRLEAILHGLDAILCSDYLKGVLTERMLQQIFRLARRRGVKVMVAPKDSNRNKYRGAGILVPNSVELARLTGVTLDSSGAWLNTAAAKVLCEMEIQTLLVTRGREGMSLFEVKAGAIQQVHIPTMARSVYDVTGAGDTALSAFTLAVAAGTDCETAARLANVAAGIVVGKRGTASATVHEIQERMRELHPTEWREEERPLESGRSPSELEAGSARVRTGIGAND
jgi:D-beta-D-heptose 7-phosphate kinase/D-beta-D-heptose 1-phosphate adenosyltransferase